MMIQLPAVLLALSGTLIAQTEAITKIPWQWESTFNVSKPGMVRLELPPAVLDASRADLGDLRIRPRGGRECPYLFDVPVRRADILREAGDFQVSLADRTTFIEVSVKPADRIQAVDLVSPALEFLKSVRIEGLGSTRDWQVLVPSAVIFRQLESQSRMRIPLPSGAWERLRFLVDDERSKPIPFTGVRTVTGPEKLAVTELPVTMVSREELPGETRLTLDLGAQNLDLAEVCFEIPEALFSRPCRVGFSMPAADGGSRIEELGSGVLYRVADGDLSSEELAVPIHRRVPSRYVIVSIRNSDSPPLGIARAKVTYRPTILVFSAPQAGSWQLITGAVSERAPEYDLGALREAMANAGGERIVPGPLGKLTNYEAEPSLPGVEASGAAIDLSNWSRRRSVMFASSGVIQIELDARVLAACRGDLGDIRLVQDGRQIPYVVRPGKVRREIKPVAFVMKNETNRPTFSRWETTMPIEGLPAVNLGARSTGRLFARRFLASAEREDRFGNHWIEELGRADWTKTGDQDSPLVLNFHGSRLPKTFFIEADHGDNPPIPVDDVVIRFDAPSIAAKLASEEPLYLCYGNLEATSPQYDLRLVWDELMASAQQSTALGDEEFLRPETKKHDSAMGAGAPWLWAALAGVVAVLLAIVAKLLPRESSP